MDILVTGGAGFLGSHLCDRLLGLGHDVVCLDDLSTGSRDNIAHLVDEPRFQLVEHDVTERFHFKVDRIYNLACPASPVHYQRDPIKTVVTNVEGTLNGLRLAKETGARFFQASTSEVYGDPDVHPQPESYNGNVSPIGPRACYDEGKRCSETLCFDFHRQAGVEIRVARIFNTYGPRMAVHDGRVVSNFIVQALQGEDLTVYGEGQQTRSFCFMNDLIDGFLGLMELEGVTGPVNIGNPVEHTVLQLAQIIIDDIGSSSRIIHEALPQDDPKQRRPDISLAQELFDFAPKTRLSEGLGRTIEYFRARLDRDASRGSES